jgi:hypothetical protein
MTRILIVDLEGVLIKTVREPILHPQATEILAKSRQDFDRTYLWTLAQLQDAYNILKHYELTRYFSRMIGAYFEGEKIREAMIGIQDGKWDRRFRYMPKTTVPKDMRVLGEPENMVLLEDVVTMTTEQIEVVAKILGIDPQKLPEELRVMRNGNPKDRIVYIDSFTGNGNHSLIEAYAKVLSKLDPSR